MEAFDKNAGRMLQLRSHSHVRATSTIWIRADWASGATKAKERKPPIPHNPLGGDPESVAD